MRNTNNTVRKTISKPGVILKKIGRARITQGGKSNTHEIMSFCWARVIKMNRA